MRMRMEAAQLLAFGLIGLPRRIFRSAVYKERPRAEINRILWLTPGGRHAWCESHVGPVRKPLASVPREMIAEFRRAS